MTNAGFGRVVYSVGGHEITEFTGTDPSPRSAEILDGITEVIGPVLNEKGRQIHRDGEW
jgi:hypothetical protein